LVQEWSAEVTVDEALARRLLRDQFPELELRSLRVLGEGWDVTVWLVDEEWTFRFPRREEVIPGLENEIRVLGRLGPLLPLPIPVPALVGRPSEAYRWPFYGARFLPGRELADAALDDEFRTALARPLAEFLRALHRIELDVELPVDQMQRADMRRRVPRMIERLEEVERLGLWDVPGTVREVAAAAELLDPPVPTAIVHGDLHLRHLLVGEAGEPTAVIDWIDVCRGDPSIDLPLFWSVLPPNARGAFLEVYGPLTDEQLLRGRVLALFLCGTLAVYAHSEGMEALEREAVAGLHRAAIP
jgi:aminoglycoside phosphotransferase (APT) family kinase protein